MGHAGFFGIGAYIQAVMTTFNLMPIKQARFADIFYSLSNSHNILEKFGQGFTLIFKGFVELLASCGLLVGGKNIYGADVLVFPPGIALLAAVCITVLIAFLIGMPVLKLKGHYLAMATLGFGIIIHTLVVSIDIFGLADGIHSVPPFPLLPGIEVSGKIDARIGNYYIAAFVLVVGVILALNLIHSRIGRALRAIHGNEQAASSLGINASRYKLLTFVASAVFAAIGGAFLVHYNGGIGPSDIDVMKSVRYVAIVAAGGMDSLWGVLYMGFFLNFISLRGVFGSFDDIFFACILIVIMLFLPKGLIRMSYVESLRNKIFKRMKN
jgi:branched-chain amino acid transport system permease protein